MEISLAIKMNEKLFLRNPEQTELGKKIILFSIQLIHEKYNKTTVIREVKIKILHLWVIKNE